MNPVLILSYNNLEALKKCVESVRAQDVPTDIYVEDNGSCDGSQDWLRNESGVLWCCNERNEGVSFGWNDGLGWIFDTDATKRCGDPPKQNPPAYALVLNQDTVLPTYAYRELLAFNVPFVTGTPVEVSEEFSIEPGALVPHPCFSAFLIRRSCWETVGQFDEKMFAWAGDCDYHVRGHWLGVPMYKSTIPFLHHAGTTLRTAPPDQKKWFAERANADRAVFKSKYGCEPGEPEYELLFLPELFGLKKSG